MKKGIFTTEKRGIDLNGGRKANILASMAKKASLTLTLEKHGSQPFMGHSVVESELSASTIPSEAFKRASSQEFSTDTIRKIVKEQLQESALFKDNQTQKIETLHKALDNLSKSTVCLIDDKTKSLRKEFSDLLKDSQNTMINNMKMFIGVMSKETHEQFSKKFVPCSFVEEIQKQLEYFEDRLDKIEKSPLQSSVVRRSAKEIFEQQIENTVHKTLNEMESLRKMIAQLTEDKDKMAGEIVSLNRNILEISLKNAENNTRVVELAKKTSQNIEMEISKVKQSLQENATKSIKCIKRIGSKNFSKSPSPSQKGKHQKQNQDTSDAKMPSLSVIDEPSVASIVMGMSVMDESYRVNSSPYVNKNKILETPVTPTNHNSLLCSGGYSILGDELSGLKIKTQESVDWPEPPDNEEDAPETPKVESAQKISEEIPSEQTSQSSHPFLTAPQPLPVQLYQIDQEGHLLDDEGQYIEDQAGELIKLTNEQINSLKTSQLLVTDE